MNSLENKEYEILRFIVLVLFNLSLADCRGCLGIEDSAAAWVGATLWVGGGGGGGEGGMNMLIANGDNYM